MTSAKDNPSILSSLLSLQAAWRQENGDYPESKQDCADALDPLIRGLQAGEGSARPHQESFQQSFQHPLVERWRELSRQWQPLECAPISQQQRDCVTRANIYTICAAELESFHAKALAEARALPPPRAEDRWQPMATAPRVDWESAAWFAGKARNLRALRSRARAGESATELAEDYRLPVEWVQRVIEPGFDILSGDPFGNDAVVWHIELFREEDGRFACEFASGDGRIGGMCNYSSTPVGALAELCAALIRMDEDDSIDRRLPAPPDGSSPQKEGAA